MGPLPETYLANLMRCPKCNLTNNFVLEAKRCTVASNEDALKRKRVCKNCSTRWTTTERVDKWDFELQQWTGHAEPEPEPQLPKVSEPVVVRARSQPQPAKPAAFHPVTIEQTAGVLLGIPADVCLLLVEWWNSSRRSKHGAQATWTERAFTMSVDRVKKLPHWQQVLLVTAGVEHGWQALNPSYCKDLLAQQQKQQQQHGGFRPQSSGLAGALAIIQGGGNCGPA